MWWLNTQQWHGLHLVSSPATSDGACDLGVPDDIFQHNFHLIGTQFAHTIHTIQSIARKIVAWQRKSCKFTASNAWFRWKSWSGVWLFWQWCCHLIAASWRRFSFSSPFFGFIGFSRLIRFSSFNLWHYYYYYWCLSAVFRCFLTQYTRYYIGCWCSDYLWCWWMVSGEWWLVAVCFGSVANAWPESCAACRFFGLFQHSGHLCVCVRDRQRYYINDCVGGGRTQEKTWAFLDIFNFGSHSNVSMFIEHELELYTAPLEHPFFFPFQRPIPFVAWLEHNSVVLFFSFSIHFNSE